MGEMISINLKKKKKKIFTEKSTILHENAFPYEFSIPLNFKVQSFWCFILFVYLFYVFERKNNFKRKLIYATIVGNNFCFLFLFIFIKWLSHLMLYISKNFLKHCLLFDDP